MCNCHKCVMGLYRICTQLFWCGISMEHLFTSSPPSSHPPNPLSSSGSPCCKAFTTLPCLGFLFLLLPCDIPFCLFFKGLFLICYSKFLWAPSSPSSFIVLGLLATILYLFPPYPGVFLLCTLIFSFSIPVMDINTTPPIPHHVSLFFLEGHLGSSLSLLPFIVCQSLPFRPSLFHFYLSHGDLGWTCPPSPPSPSILLNPTPPEISEASYIS